MRLGRVAKGLIIAIYLVGMIEGLSYLLIAIGNTRLYEPIRRLESIYADQGEQIELFLAGGDLRTQFDPELGWRYRPGFEGETDSINSAGLRAASEYSLAPDPAKRRVAVFGDSFVYGTEVSNPDCWPAIAERIAPDLELLNYGVPGYGSDQAFLLYEREGQRYAPEQVLVGFAPVNMRRIVNVYRRFISTHEAPLVKPRFLLEPDGSLRLFPNPLPTIESWQALLDDPAKIREWGEFDHWYAPAIYDNPLYDAFASVRLASHFWTRLTRRYLDPDRLFDGPTFRPSSTAFRIQVAVLRAWVDRIEANGAKPTIVMLPDLDSIAGAGGGDPVVYAPLVAALREKGIEVWDAVEAFPITRDEEVLQPLFMPGGHYSPEGNALVANWIVPKLEAQPDFYEASSFSSSK
jgi:hypothetical protein